jgi:hypothetical protein
MQRATPFPAMQFVPPLPKFLDQRVEGVWDGMTFGDL